MQLHRHLLNKGRALRLRLLGVKLAKPRMLGRGIDCRRGFRRVRGRISIAEGAWIESGVLLHAFGGEIAIARDVFLGPYTVIYGHGGVHISEGCLLGMHCRILSSNHAVPPLDVPIRSQADELRPTRIGRDVWLGAGVTVLGGVVIGDGCIVGAGAVVTKDLPAGSISQGVPAVVRRWRAGATPK